MRLHLIVDHRLISFLAILLVASAPALAWGPHGRITSAARETLPADSPLRARLGETLFASLDQLCMLADWRREVRPDFFPDDYLLFPASPEDRNHSVPEVRKTYAPFFRRALWALRHETPENAARWVGALLHYVSDTGSPPHAASIRGPQHAPMEGWVDSKAIAIAGYRPLLLGDTDDAAVQGLLNRMEELIAFSLARAAKLAALDPKAPRRDLSESLECALESARVTADVLHTLGERLRTPEQGGIHLRGRVLHAAFGDNSEYLPAVATHVVVVGTDWATVTDAAGSYEFRHLPAGTYRLGAVRPGSTLAMSEPFALADEEPAIRGLSLVTSKPPGNRVRNPDFVLHWLRPDAPDCWRPLTIGYPERPPPEPGWQSENVAVTPGTRYHVGAERKPGGATVRIVARWRGHAMANFSVIEHTISAEEGEVLTTPSTAKYLQILLVGTVPHPTSAVLRVWCVAEPAGAQDAMLP